LSDLCFVLAKGGSEVVVGLHDGHQPICFTGEGNWDHKTISVRNLVFHNHLFSKHLGEYLRQLEGGLVPLDRGSGFPGPFAPMPHNSFELQGNVFRVVAKGENLHEISLKPQTLVGEMFSERELPIKLPSQIACVFDKFGKFNPIVVGKALRDVLTGKEVTLVEFLLPCQDCPNPYQTGLERFEAVAGNAFKTVFSYALDDSVIEFDMNGCCYHMHFWQSPLSLSEWLRDPRVMRFSVQGLYSVNAEEVRGTRTAFGDLGNGKMRAVSEESIHKAYHHATGTLNEAMQNQSLEGFELLLPNRRACLHDGLALI
jgi:hypothetical protein